MGTTLNIEVVETGLALKSRAVWTFEGSWATLLHATRALELRLHLLTRPELRVKA